MVPGLSGALRVLLRLRLGLGLGLAVLVSAGPAAAVEFAVVAGPHYPILTVSGRILPEDDRRFQAALAANPGVGEVWLASQGGSLGAGIAMGDLIREKRLPTRVRAGTTCASACFFAFVGGFSRTVEPGGRIGLHNASRSGSERYRQLITEALLDPTLGSVDQRVEQIIMVTERFAASAAGAQAVHLVKMGVSLRVLDRIFGTFHDDIHWLTPAELTSYNVVN